MCINSGFHPSCHSTQTVLKVATINDKAVMQACELYKILSAPHLNMYQKADKVNEYFQYKPIHKE